MAIALRLRASRTLERVLRWLTVSALRSMTIFVILTFVPILLLTYYIVATSIRNAKADAAAADRQVRDFGISLLRTDFRGEHEVLVGAADEMALSRALQVSGSTTQRADLFRQQAVANLSRLLRRRAEFAYIALYSADALLQAVAPPTAAAAASLHHPGPGGGDSLPPWFDAALREQSAASPLLPPPALAPAPSVSTPPPPPAIIVLTVPVLTDTRASGVLLGALPQGAVNDWVRHINTGPDRFLYLMDSRHQLVGVSPGAPLAAAQLEASSAVAEALAGRSGSEDLLTPSRLESHAITYAPLPEDGMALLVVRPVRFGFFLFRVFYDKLALIAVIVFVLAGANGLLLRAAFRYYLRFTREVESGRAKTEALLGSIGDGVFAVDAQGRVIEFNRAAAALTGHSASRALGAPYTTIIALHDESADAAPAPHPDPIQQAMSEGRTLRFLRNLMLTRADNSRLAVTVSAAPVRDEAGQVAGCVAVFSDASQEREVDRMKNEFISIASHQLRTPMSGVKGVLALLLEDVLGPLNHEQREYLRRAYDANERLIALVNDLLNVSRLEQGQVQLHSEPVRLADLLRQLASEFQPRAARYRLQLRLALAAAPNAAAAVGSADDDLVFGDAVRLREVFANLLDNAIKYTPEGGEIQLALLPARDLVQIEISDTGVGIPADKLGGLFQKFNRIQNPLSGREFGTGLGLYFARSVIELHRGSIEVSSEVGRGTRFRVTLPRQWPPSSHPTAVPPESGVARVA